MIDRDHQWHRDAQPAELWAALRAEAFRSFGAWAWRVTESGTRIEMRVGASSGTEPFRTEVRFRVFRPRLSPENRRRLEDWARRLLEDCEVPGGWEWNDSRDFTDVAEDGSALLGTEVSYVQHLRASQRAARQYTLPESPAWVHE